MAKALILTGDGAEALEVMYPYQRLLEEGFEVDIAAPSAKRIQTVVHDMEDGWDTYSEKLGYRVEAHLAFSDVRPEEYDALIIPGGRAPEYIRNDEDVKSIVRYFFDNNLPVAHLCHAPLVLAAAGVLDNRETAAFPFLQPDVELAGAAFVDSEAVVDGNMVSARAWFDHPAWMRAFIEVVRSSLGALPNETSRTQESELRHLRKRLSEIEQRIDHLARG